MKKIILLFLCATIHHFGDAQIVASHRMQKVKPTSKSFARVALPLYDSLLFSIWDSTAHVWEYNTKQDSMTYNSDALMTQNVVHIYNGTAWDNYTKSQMQYDYHGNDTSHMFYSWGGTWVPSAKSLLTYDANNNHITTYSQTWNGTSYDNSHFDTYTYNSLNLLTNYLFQIWNGSSWVNNAQTIFVYDGNNNLIHSENKGWDGTSWNNSDQDNYTYDANNNQLTDTYQTWNGTFYDNASQTFNSYDANNKLIARLFQYWTGTAFSNSAKDTLIYDANNVEVLEYRENWSGSSWINGYKWEAYYHQYANSGITTIADSDNDFSISPNPLSTETTVTFSNNKAVNRTIKITNDLGEVILQSTITNRQSTINMSGFADGIYFVEITDNNKNSVNKKIIVSR